MSIRRTKHDKQAAQLHRAEKLSYEFSAPTKKSVSIKKNIVADSSDLLHFNLPFIKKDLVRTIISSVVVFGVLVALYLVL
jgi:hypothetical protein